MSSTKNPGRGRRDETLVEASRVHVVTASSPQNRKVRRNNLRLARLKVKKAEKLPFVADIHVDADGLPSAHDAFADPVEEMET